MRRCIRSLLLSVVALLICSSTVQACWFFPLFDPLNWCCGLGCSNPYATRQVIDDWLGYGYMRGTADGSLGHYPMKPWSTYAPAYPRLRAPWQPFSPMPPAMPYQANPVPLPGNLYPGNPYPGIQMPWNPMPMPGIQDDCGCGGAIAGPLPMQMPFSADPCDPCNPCPQPLTQMPIPVQIPITTYRPVTVDRGGYQMVWVSRPVTQLVPQTSWQTQYIQPAPYGQMLPGMSMPMPMSVPQDSGCGDTPCGSTSAIPQQTAMRPTYLPSTSSPQPYFGAQPHLGSVPYPLPQQHVGMRTFPGSYPMQHPYPMQPPYSGQQWQQPRTAFYSGPPASMTSRPTIPYYPPHGYPAAAYPAAGWPSPNRFAAGDIYGDHEHPAAPMTGMIPVSPNAWSGNAPIMRSSLTRPVRTTSASRYPNVVR